MGEINVLNVLYMSIDLHEELNQTLKGSNTDVYTFSLKSTAQPQPVSS